jgi:hypothetical protein
MKIKLPFEPVSSELSCEHALVPEFA